MSPKKTQISPHKHTEIYYDTNIQYTTDADSSLPLDSLGIKRVEGIIGALLYYAQYVENKLIMTLSAICSHQASATAFNSASIDQLVEYIDTYPKYGIAYRSIIMILAGHSDTSLLK